MKKAFFLFAVLLTNSLLLVSRDLGEGSWDGWIRLNNDTHEGGIIGVFRQGAPEDKRQVIVKGLDPDWHYEVKPVPEGLKIHQATGELLMKDGFQVEIDSGYDARIFEIGLSEAQ